MPLFQECLIDELTDAVIFADASLRIIRWNPGAERLTGVPAECVCLRNWAPSLLHLRDEHGRVIRDEQCPMAYALAADASWAGQADPARPRRDTSSRSVRRHPRSSARTARRRDWSS